ncbi:MAG: response regulator [Candidatus Eremiobacteraeota bacterium]|nr:response regulator [Candidatus Eremiobacteraeota bacterium]MCW5868127.1 response regulator [Candidatus Eremiobacteraeota bacterium]
MIRVLLVDRSPAGLEAVRRSLADTADLQVVGTATTSSAALNLVHRLQPAVVCLDLGMPPLDGVSLTHKIMSEKPTPVLGLSDVQERQSAFQLIQDGALDVLQKNSPGATLVAKIRVAAGVKMFSRRPAVSRPAAKQQPVPSWVRTPRVLAVGASTGGPQALHQLFSALGPNFPLPVLCVQHISPGFLDGMINWLGGLTQLRVKLAEAGERPRPGTVYFAPEECHLSLDSSGRIELDPGQRVDGHRPSATVLFQAVARAFGGSAIGVILTGMGADGAEGLLALHRAGALTLAQDEQSSVVFGMARKAVELGAIRQVLPLEEISAHLLAAVRLPEKERKKRF